MENLNEIIKWFDETFVDVDLHKKGAFEINELDRRLRERHRQILNIQWKYKNDMATVEEFDIEETMSNLAEAIELGNKVQNKLQELEKEKENKRRLYLERKDRVEELTSEINTNNEVIQNLESAINLLEEKNSNPSLIEMLKTQVEELKDRNNKCTESIDNLREEMDIIVHGGDIPEITLSNEEKKELKDTELDQDELEEDKKVEQEKNSDDKTKKSEPEKKAEIPLDELEEIIDQEAIDIPEDLIGKKDGDSLIGADSDSASDGSNNSGEQNQEEKKQPEVTPENEVPTGENPIDEEPLPEPLPEDEPSLENPLNTPQEEPIKPIVKANKPKVTWKTIASIAAGIGIGGAVFFTAGPVGVAVMTIAGSIGKKIINNQRLKLARLGSEAAIEKIEEPRPGIKGKFDKLKNYLKSDEGLRDMSSLLGAAIITGNALNIASAVQNVIAANTPMPEPLPVEPEITPTPDVIQPTPIEPTPVVDTITPTPEITPYDNIVIGDNVGAYNVSVGHDTAAWAVNGTNTETLLSQYVNGDSVFKSFASINPDGTVGQIINTDGLSITEFCAQNGLDINSVAVDVARGSDNASQAWVSASELIKGVGGPTI